MSEVRPFKRSWRLAGPLGDVVVVTRSDVRLDTRAVLYPRDISLHLERWLKTPESRQLLLEMYGAVGGQSGSASGDTAFLKARLESAFQKGELIALPMPRVAAGGSSGAVTEEQTPAPRSETPEAPVTPKTWIEIELLDRRGRPVPQRRYRIQTPDGVLHNGTLDANGRARVDGIEPGECRVTFPEK